MEPKQICEVHDRPVSDGVLGVYLGRTDKAEFEGHFSLHSICPSGRELLFHVPVRVLLQEREFYQFDESTECHPSQDNIRDPSAEGRQDSAEEKGKRPSKSV